MTEPHVRYRQHDPKVLTAVFELVAQIGPRLERIGKQLNLSVGQVAGIKRRHRIEWNAAIKAYQNALTAIREEAFGSFEIPSENGGELPEDPVPTDVDRQKVRTKETGGVLEVFADGNKIKTVDDLLRHVNADLEKYEIASQESTMWELGTKHPTTGQVTVTQLHRVYVKLRPKAGPGVREAVETLLDTAFRERVAPVVLTIPKTLGDVWQVLNIADPHFGKYSWRGSTGGPDYDLGLARTHVRGSALELLARGNMMYHPAYRTIALLGDIMHYDTPNGTTTSGTPLDRDSRLQKMIEVATDTIIDIIEASATTVPTNVVLVSGNHDEALSWAFQKALQLRFRNDNRVTIDPGFTSRKYLGWEGTLLGFAHGDKAKKKLPQLMALEAKQDWGTSSYYEIHTGHTHATAAEWQKPIETIDGVVVRVSPAICPPDDWHNAHGFIGSPRAMEAFFYRRGGGVIGTMTSSPDYGQVEEAA